MRNRMMGVVFLVLVNVVNAQAQESSENTAQPAPELGSGQAIPENAAVLIASSAIQYTFAKEAKPKYPAKISVVSAETNDQGRLKIRLRLKIDKDVAIYANPVCAPGMDHVSARVTILDADKKPQCANVTYPKGTKLHRGAMGDWCLYRKSADIDVLLPNNPPLPLTVRAWIAGYNERVPCCLGIGILETTLTTRDKKTEPGSRSQH